jgi:protein-disulfide isomerase
MQDYIKPWYLKWWGLAIISISILALCLLSAFGFYIIDKASRLRQIEAYSGEKLIKNTNLQPTDLSVLDLKDNYRIGAANPKITMIVFADFTCASCRESFTKFRRLSVDYKNDVRLIFVDYPVMSDNSTALALAARCAGEQGLFWSLHDRFFIHKNINSKKAVFTLAEQTGADMIRFKTCYESEKYLPQIKSDFQDGLKLGISGTPTWFINGYRIEGDMPEEMMIGLVESLLK